MRKIFTTIIAFLCYTIMIGQANEKMIKIKGSVYSYTSNKLEDTVHQKGFFSLTDGELKRHGIWVLYINGELKSVGEYKEDKLIWFSANNEIHYKEKLKKLRSHYEVVSN